MDSTAVIVCHPDLAQDAWKGFCSRLVAGELASEGEVIYSGRNELRLYEHEGIRVVSKRFPNRTFYQGLVYRIVPGKAKRSYRNALRLRERGVGTPQPLAFVEQWLGNRPGPAWYCCAHDPAPHTLRDYCLGHLQDDLLLPQLAAFVAQLHEHGIYHQDLTPGNILMERTGETWRFSLVDCNRISFGPLSNAKRRQNLIQIDLPEQTTAELLGHYCQHCDWDRDRALKKLRRQKRRHEWLYSLKRSTRPWRRRLGI